MGAQENHFPHRTNGMDPSAIHSQPDYVDPFEILDGTCVIYRKILELGKWGPKLSINFALQHRNRSQSTTQNSLPPTVSPTPTPTDGNKLSVNQKGSKNNKMIIGMDQNNPTAEWKDVVPEKGQPTTKLANGEPYN